ncbi:tyrosine-type recombinase/integrase [Roseofilum sp. BLCC_M91]|uniref:Tyrosine-type recombinase/integrase n=1 Tax=Roseofilum halophilum BLCC-M91 TaxID=3022259 RepID=A0ABT7BJH1_9CYAN|nr:tyrosine-type recombinase/integrase [Roseofilum halophilum]MDJ1179327.1 tyrosine-type recombinase/integrase [Roseofilum halophilum BLCC-M91]
MKQLSTVRSSVGTFDRVAKRVSLINRSGSIQLRWTYAGKRFHLAIGGLTKSTIEVAYAKANAIAADIALNRFDESLAKYTNRPTPIKQEETIATLWEKYKIKSQGKTSPTTQKSVWVEIDRAIETLPREALKLSNIDALGREYLKIRKPSTTHRHFESLQPAIRAALPGIKLKEQLPKKAKKPIRFFTPDEVRAIVQGFEGNHYERYVSFLSSTGCRPEEAIALTPSDISSSSQGTECTFDKAFSKGILSLYTKNHLVRTIPVSDMAIQSIEGHHGAIIFPSLTGEYINQNNFRNRAWKPLVKKLAQSGAIRRYLPPYALRHSFISNMYHRGVPLPTIAWLVGDRVETILKFYAGIERLSSSDLPDLY